MILSFPDGNSYLLLASDRNQTVLELTPTTITRRIDACAVENEKGIVLILDDSLNVSRTIANGYSSKVCASCFVFLVSSTR